MIIGGTIPTYFNPGQQFSLTQSNSFLYVPSNLISLAKQAYPNATQIDTTISEFNLLWENASPATFNVASTPIRTSVDLGQISDGSQSVIPIPQNGYLTIGPFAAGSDGTYAAVAVGTANATVSIVDSASNSLLSFDVACKVPAPLELIA